MALTETVLKRLLTLVTVIALVAIANSIYQYWFSDYAKLRREYEKKVAEAEARILVLQSAHDSVLTIESVSLEKIAAMRDTIEGLLHTLTTTQAQLNDLRIRTSIMHIDTVLSEIFRSSRDIVARGRALRNMSGPPPGTGH